MNHIKPTIPIVLLFITSACVSTSGILPEEQARFIPDQARTIMVRSDITADSLYRHTLRTLLRQGYRIEQKDDALHSISTGAYEIGQSTKVRYDIYIENTGSSTTARLNADWQAGIQGNAMAEVLTGVNYEAQWDQAIWGEGGRPSRAFAQMYKFAQGLPYRNIEFQIQP